MIKEAARTRQQNRVYPLGAYERSDDSHKRAPILWTHSAEVFVGASNSKYTASGASTRSSEWFLSSRCSSEHGCYGEFPGCCKGVQRDVIDGRGEPKGRRLVECSYMGGLGESTLSPPLMTAAMACLVRLTLEPVSAATNLQEIASYLRKCKRREVDDAQSKLVDRVVFGLTGVKWYAPRRMDCYSRCNLNAMLSKSLVYTYSIATYSCNRAPL